MMARGRWTGAAAAGWLACIAAGQEFTPQTKQDVIEKVQETLTRKAYVAGVDFGRLPEFLSRHREELTRAASPGEFAYFMSKTLQGFGISHVAVMPPEALERSRRVAEAGIGAVTRPASGGLRVVGLHEGGPASRTTLRPGDIIVAIDGAPARDPDELEGTPGTSVRLRVRKLSGQVEEVRITRGVVELRDPATFQRLSDRTALVRIPTFADGYDHAEIEDLIDKAFEYENLIIDLRGNGGGAVFNLMHLMGLLMPEGTVLGTPVTNVLAARFVADAGGDPADAAAVAAWATESKMVAGPNSFGPYPGRVAVLIDGGSASASEVSSAGLRENRGALIVGQKSAGALLVSTFEELPGGFSLQYPISDYITAKGFRPEGRGIEPDIVVAAPRRGADATADAARRALEAGGQAPAAPGE
jgi:carboxyl-terminal processing protease